MWLERRASVGSSGTIGSGVSFHSKRVGPTYSSRYSSPPGRSVFHTCPKSRSRYATWWSDRVHAVDRLDQDALRSAGLRPAVSERLARSRISRRARRPATADETSALHSHGASGSRLGLLTALRLYIFTRGGH